MPDAAYPAYGYSLDRGDLLTQRRGIVNGCPSRGSLTAYGSHRIVRRASFRNAFLGSCETNQTCAGR
ncbi:hypothetical protein KCP73_06050 [Salmonella enterica subsp. enterica]|nr:hypothetical protein KCP73_06050 [Salmonella enterica subsp. enterica]